MLLGPYSFIESDGFRKQKKYTDMDRFYTNDTYSEIPTKNEPIRSSD